MVFRQYLLATLAAGLIFLPANAQPLNPYKGNYHGIDVANFTHLPVFVQFSNIACQHELVTIRPHTIWAYRPKPTCQILNTITLLYNKHGKRNNLCSRDNIDLSKPHTAVIYFNNCLYHCKWS